MYGLHAKVLVSHMRVFVLYTLIYIPTSKGMTVARYAMIRVLTDKR